VTSDGSAPGAAPPSPAGAVNQTLLAQMQEIFRDVLERPELVITAESNSETVEGWDSLIHVVLGVAITHRYKVKFALSEMKRLTNVGDLVRELELKLNAS
jgi:acyl carrier protein